MTPPPGAGENDSTPEIPQSPRRLRAVEPAEDGTAPRTQERPPHNLPLELSSFVGREKELAEVKRLLEDNRLLTLTGAGGCGKTRLALEAAGDLARAYPDGVWLVELAPLTDPSLVPQAVASVLGVREQPGRSLTESMADYLRAKNLLLPNPATPSGSPESCTPCCAARTCPVRTCWWDTPPVVCSFA